MFRFTQLLRFARVFMPQPVQAGQGQPGMAAQKGMPVQRLKRGCLLEIMLGRGKRLLGQRPPAKDQQNSTSHGLVS